MRRSLLSSPWIRLLAVMTFSVASMAPACDPPPPTPGGACRAAQLVSGADFACIRVSPFVVCNDRLDAGGAGLPGCYGASTLVRCWGAYGADALSNPATLEPVVFDASAPPPEFTLALGAGSTADQVRRLDRAGGVVPALVPGWLQGARHVAVGGEVDTGQFVCAALGDHRVRCEGQGGLGQLGDARFETRLSEMPRGTELTFAGAQVDGVYAGQVHACALLRDGSVHCWGSNFFGALGPAAASSLSAPVRVTGLPRAVRVVAGRRHNCAVVEVSQAGAMGADAATRREVRCWGDGSAGQLGHGANTGSATPVAVLAPTGSGNLTDVESLAAGKEHTCAVVTGGAVYCWGSNSGGQLGVASPSTSNRPVAVALPGGAGAFELSAGREHTCALMLPLALEGVPVRCWGRMGSARVTPPGTITEELACCAPTPSNPRGICPRLQDDPANCGRAGNACAAGQSCVNGACACAAPWRMCGATCIDVQSDPANCGTCGNACPTPGAGNGAFACRGGSCALTCPPGRGDCDGNLANGCETDTTSSPMHCGACGRAATVANGTPTCRMGAAAVMACNAGFGDCDANAANGCEATLASDANNCGRCGNRCGGASGSTMSACAMGACGAQTCAAGYRDCNNDPTDGCETPMGAACASPPTALPAASRLGAMRHVVNIVTATDQEPAIQAFLNSVPGAGVAGPTSEFYKYFRDEYDFLVLVSARPLMTSAAGVFTAVRRDAISGTGAGRRNQPAYRTGAPRRLRGVFTVNQSDTGTPPTLHELLHYWGVEYPDDLIGISSGHWGVASVGGQLGGFPASVARCGSGGALDACVASQVCCASGTTNCGGTCTDTATDANNCGGCGIVCASGPGTAANECVAGRCRPRCDAAYLDCDRNPGNGCEVRADSPAHCGGCYGCGGFGCADSGGGVFVCAARCGASGQVCCPPPSGRPSCGTGLSCLPTGDTSICCAAGQVACDGVCSTTATDARNCGGCGVVCATGAATTANACVAGRCTPTCAAGFADCDGNPGNGCEARLDAVTSCGACGTRCAAGQSCANSGGRLACAAASASSAGQVCAAAGTCGGSLRCSSSVSVVLPPRATSDVCRASSGRDTLPWFTAQAPGDSIPYAPLELYMMGLVDGASAGGPWYVLDGATQPPYGSLWSGTALRRVTLDDLVARVGARAPATAEERAFRTAVVVFSTTPVSDARLSFVERWASVLGNDTTDPCLFSFQGATGGRATMSTVLGTPRVP